MYNSSFGDRSIVDKMMRLFIIQAISSFVSRDYDSGLHYLNEVKTHFAQNQSTLNSTLKGLAKEIIQSLDMLAPGADASQFLKMETGFAEQPKETQPPQETYHSVGEEFKAILKRRKKQETSPEVQQPPQSSSDDLFAGLGELRLTEENERRRSEVIQNLPTNAIEQPSNAPKSVAEEYALTEERIRAEDNAIIEVLLKRKKLRGELSKEDENLLQILQERKERRAQTQNPIESIRKKRRRRRSRLWDEE